MPASTWGHIMALPAPGEKRALIPCRKAKRDTNKRNKPSLSQLLGLCTSKEHCHSGRTAVPAVLELTARERAGTE